jgi:hypothetical protein
LVLVFILVCVRVTLDKLVCHSSGAGTVALGILLRVMHEQHRAHRTLVLTAYIHLFSVSFTPNLFRPVRRRPPPRRSVLEYQEHLGIVRRKVEALESTGDRREGN